MSLYVIPVPAPPAGADWRYTVPGQYLEHVTGITATLNTTTFVPGTVEDVSGNGNNGSTFPASIASDYVAGALTGDPGLELGTGAAPFREVGFYPNENGATFSAGWTFSYWARNTQFNSQLDLAAYDAGAVPLFTLGASQTGNVSAFINATGAEADAGLVFPLDGNWHMVTFVYHDATGRFSIYIDGVLKPLVIDTAGGPVAPPTVDQLTFGQQSFNNPQSRGAVDEMFVVDAELSGATIAAIYATAPDFANYTAAVLAQSPGFYYHLDPFTLAGGGRQVTLEITDGTHDVADIPAGFPTVVGASLFGYSWQPNLNSSSQTPAGTVTTVAIPDLILPAGYTVGTRTLDLASSDQWSDIFVWWNTDVMDASTFHNPYLYPPGATLQALPIGT